MSASATTDHNLDWRIVGSLGCEHGSSGDIPDDHRKHRCLAGPFEVGGKQYQLLRETFVCTADFMSGTSKREISADGRALTTWFEAKYVNSSKSAAVQ